jgi:cytochrome c-type biogenesis protein CcmH/NrfG
VAQARILARNRHLEQAEDLLLPLASRAKAPAEVLDLLARVCVHQGKAAEARALWLRMLNDDPGNTHVLRALLKCATLERVMTKKPSFIRLLFWLRMRYWSR